MAGREHILREIEAPSPPWCDEYLRHRRQEMIKEMNKSPQ
jgi:hypothetical protein